MNLVNLMTTAVCYPTVSVVRLPCVGSHAETVFGCISDLALYETAESGSDANEQFGGSLQLVATHTRLTPTTAIATTFG